MARIVMKFGGTSMAGIERIRNVAVRVKREAEKGNEVLVVVSAMAGETDRLVQFCREAAALHDPREYDVVVASGEQVTAGLLAMTLQNMGLNARSFMGWQLVRASGVHGNARVEAIESGALDDAPFCGMRFPAFQPGPPNRSRLGRRSALRGSAAPESTGDRSTIVERLVLVARATDVTRSADAHAFRRALAAGPDAAPARTHRAMTSVLAGDDLDPVVAGSVLGQDLRRRIAGAVIDDDPAGRANRLAHHGVQRLAHVLRLVAARRDQNITLCHIWVVHILGFEPRN